MIDAMIFSKNRPMQLHALLASIKKHTNLSPESITVLHNYDEDFQEGLSAVKEKHRGVNFLQEINFTDQVKTFLKLGSKFCVFFVDDMIVKDDIDFNVPCSILETNPQIINFSLRLGTHLHHCYPVNSSQSVPDGTVRSGFFIWDWKNSQLDWNYPFSVDGHIFRRSELEGWSSHLSFSRPNNFEESMQQIKNFFVLPSLGCCYVTSKVFNMPLNRVQNDVKNRAENISVESLNTLWLEGKELDIDKVYKFLNIGAHQPLELPLRDIK